MTCDAQQSSPTGFEVKLPGLRVAVILYTLIVAFNLRNYPTSMRTETSPTVYSHSRLGASLAAVFALVVAWGATGCDGLSSPAKPGRVVLIGIDGASPRIVNEMFAKGELPNLAKLAREGVSGELRSAMPMHSPRIWNTIATGMTPEQHGIVGFSYSNQNGHRKLYLSTDRKAPPLWSIASAAGLRVGVINFWNTYPLEKLDGVMVSDHVLAKEIEGRKELTGAAQTETGAVIFPEAWNEKLVHLIKDNATPVPDFKDPFAPPSILPRWVIREELQRRFKEDGAIASMTSKIVNEERPDVTMVLLYGIDRVSHYLWGVMESPKHYTQGLIPTPETRAGGRDALFAYYQYTDALLGEIIKDYGPNDLVMVVSDHGFEAEQGMLRLTGNHTTEKAINGVIFARGRGIEPGSKAKQVSINDITPTILTWLGFPTANDMAGVPADFLSEEVRGAVTPVSSYKDLKLEYVDTKPLPSGVEDDIVEQLRALGYIDEP
jgi:predicted AlkP superfamily phosphohydrolase/phosphomutase